MELRLLNLQDCDIKLPCAFGGFAHLTRLVLERISIDVVELENLIQKCRASESLRLLFIPGVEDLNIFSANVKFVELDIAYTSVHYVNAANIVTMALEIGVYLKPSEWGTIVIEDRLSNLDQLSMPTCFFLLGVKGNQLSRITKLSLNHHCLHLNHTDKVSAFLSVLGKFPSLQELSFIVCFKGTGVKGQNFPENLKQLKLARLQAVRVDYGCPIKVLEEFSHLIIGNSPLLQTLEITKFNVTWISSVKRGRKPSRFQKRLDKVFYRLKKCSPQAKVIHKPTTRFCFHDRSAATR